MEMKWLTRGIGTDYFLIKEAGNEDVDFSLKLNLIV
jgi:hypothetical protein